MLPHCTWPLFTSCSPSFNHSTQRWRAGVLCPDGALSPDALLVNPHPAARKPLNPKTLNPAALAGWCTDRLYEAGGESGVGALGSQFGTPERSGQALAVAVCLGYIAGSAAAKWARSRRQLQARHRCSLVMRAPHAAGACGDGSGRQRRTEAQAAAQDRRESTVAFT